MTAHRTASITAEGLGVLPFHATPPLHARLARTMPTSIRSRCIARTHLAALVVALALPSLAIGAQSAQSVSAQLSLFGTTLSDGSGSSTGLGAEGQLRLNRVATSERLGALSLGAGGQWTSHDFRTGAVTLQGLFVEPRFAFARRIGAVYPYLSARLAWLQQSSAAWSSSSGSAFGAGGGLAWPVTSRVNVDLGLSWLSQSLGTARTARSGLAVSFPTLSSWAGKIGLSVGL